MSILVAALVATGVAAQATHNLTIVAPLGKGSVELAGVFSCAGPCVQPIAAGATTTLTAVPSAGWTFAGWVAGPCVGGAGPCTFTMDGPKTVRAKFTTAVERWALVDIGVGDLDREIGAFDVRRLNEAGQVLYVAEQPGSVYSNIGGTAGVSPTNAFGIWNAGVATPISIPPDGWANVYDLDDAGTPIGMRFYSTPLLVYPFNQVYEANTFAPGAAANYFYRDGNLLYFDQFVPFAMNGATIAGMHFQPFIGNSPPDVALIDRGTGQLLDVFAVPAGSNYQFVDINAAGDVAFVLTAGAVVSAYVRDGTTGAYSVATTPPSFAGFNGWGFNDARSVAGNAYEFAAGRSRAVRVDGAVMSVVPEPQYAAATVFAAARDVDNAGTFVGDAWLAETAGVSGQIPVRRAFLSDAVRGARDVGAACPRLGATSRWRAFVLTASEMNDRGEIVVRVNDEALLPAPTSFGTSQSPFALQRPALVAPMNDWTGPPTGGDAGLGGNWRFGAPPGPGDHAGVAAAVGATVAAPAAGWTVRSLTVGAAGGGATNEVVFPPGAALVASNGVYVVEGGKLTDATSITGRVDVEGEVRPPAGGTLTINGDVVLARGGLGAPGASTIVTGKVRGAGILRGAVSAPSVVAKSPMRFPVAAPLAAGDAWTIVTTDPVDVRHLAMTGGSAACAQGFLVGEDSTLSGRGALAGPWPFDPSAFGSTVTAVGGTLTIGDPSAPDAFDFPGVLSAAPGATLVVASSTALPYGYFPGVVPAGGTVQLPTGSQRSFVGGHGVVAGLSAVGTIAPSGGTLVLQGDVEADAVDCTGGGLEVFGNLVVRDGGAFNLNGGSLVVHGAVELRCKTASLGGGSLASDAAVVLFDTVVSGPGAIAAAAGVAGAGLLFDASTTSAIVGSAPFESHADFDVGAGSLRVVSGGVATFEGRLTLAGGSIDAPGGIRLASYYGVADPHPLGGPVFQLFEGELAGFGNVFGPYDDGGFTTCAQGELDFHGPAIFAGAVKSRVAGSTAGAYGRVVCRAAASVAATLAVEFDSGYAPPSGTTTSFDLFDWTGVVGTFVAYALPVLDAPLTWNASALLGVGTLSAQTATPGAVTVVAGPSPAATPVGVPGVALTVQVAGVGPGYPVHVATTTGTLGGTTDVVTDGAGSATFDAFTFDAPGSYQLVVSAPFAVPATTSNVAAYAQASFVGGGSLGGVAVGDPSLACAVALDAPAAGVVVNLVSLNGPLAGTTTAATDSAGVAHFSGLALGSAGLHTLYAFGTDFGSATAVVAAVSSVAIVAPPSPPFLAVNSVGSTLSAQIDLPVAGVVVVLQADAGSVGGVAAVATDANGAAVFDAFTLDTPGTRGLTAHVGPLSSASAAIVVYGLHVASVSPDLLAAPVAPGSPPVPLSVTGSGFAPTSVVYADRTALPTTYVGPTTLTATLPSSHPGLAAVGGVAICVSNGGANTSNAAALEVGDHANAGTIVQRPLDPAPGEPFVLRIEGCPPSMPFFLAADLLPPPPLFPFPDATADLVLGVFPSPFFIVLVDGLGLFGPPDGTAFGFEPDGAPPYGAWSSPAFARPIPATGITLSLQALYLDLSAPAFFRATHTAVRINY